MKVVLFFSSINNLFTQNEQCSTSDINTEPFHLAFSSARDLVILILEVKSRDISIKLFSGRPILLFFFWTANILESREADIRPI